MIEVFRDVRHATGCGLSIRTAGSRSPSSKWWGKLAAGSVTEMIQGLVSEAKRTHAICSGSGTPDCAA